MRLTPALLLLLTPALHAQKAPARLVYIYRDSVKSGVDSVYRAIENDAAQNDRSSTP